MQSINTEILDDLISHVRSLSLRNRLFLSSMRYERCAEFPLIVENLQPLLNKKLSMLDIGTGDSGLPTYLLKRSMWDITCLDQSDWVSMQELFLLNSTGRKSNERFHVIIDDFLDHDFQDKKFDVITCISVIEHIPEKGDSEAIMKMASLLSSGGLLILTTPVNGGGFKDFYLNKTVYGKSFKGDPVFFQRHYDEIEMYRRLIRPSNLIEQERVYFGEYGFQFKELFLDPPPIFKPIKVLYQWCVPFFARLFLRYKAYPVSRTVMKMYTSSGVFLMLRK